MSQSVWHTGRFEIDLACPRVMGIVNVTPDSFSDGGDHLDLTAALNHCERLLKEGADILDIGGESSRPGALPVPLGEELRRVTPVLRHAVKLGVPVSIDTYKPDVMAHALDLGVDIINDIYGLRRPGALDVVSAHAACGVCLMHMRGEPASMQQQVISNDVVDDVRSFLAARVEVLTQLGVDACRVVLDPGIGFGKTVEQNFELLRRQAELLDLGLPILVGWSRKSSLGAVSGRPAGERGVLSAAAALAAVQLGARVVRVHDVADTVDALKVWGLAGLCRPRH
ncbi:dihydropteroate synthase [Aquabacterium sp.]|uniref:dihydropteroate synthase n=1 Tax=Aquabacterium sp. TaxID=1872578 RepID=UPI0035B123ED